jgi:hypothetical protein
MVATTTSSNSLHLLLENESTNNAIWLSLKGLINCGATSDFIDSVYVTANGIPVRRLSQPILVFNVNSSPNEASFIQDVASLVLHYKGHSKQVQLAVTGLGNQKAHPWVLLAL